MESRISTDPRAEVTDMKLLQCTVGMVQTNCYLIVNEETREIVVVDPGDSGEQLYKLLEREKLTLKAILLTHGHFDHMLAVPYLREQTGATVYAAAAEEGLLQDVQANLTASWNGRGMKLRADRYLTDGELFTEAGCEITMILTPGHTAGSCCYYLPQESWLFAGDTLFYESYGRIDLPTARPAAIGHSIRERLLVLPEETEVYPGHGEATTIEHERKWNPAAV